MNATATFPLTWSHRGFLSIDRRQAVSDDAATIDRCVLQVRKGVLRSLTLSRTNVLALQALEDARSEASVPNWDGYGARPINSAAYLQASDFIRALSSETPLPDVGVDPDGEVSIEWHFDSRHVLTLSIDGQGRIAYSALIGISKKRGTEWLVDGVPRDIADTLGRLVAASHGRHPAASQR